MGKRYYCDFCDKSFPDNPTNRRNHMNGIQHRTERTLYYDSFQDPEIILAEDSRKNPCRQFQLTGNCKFGVACRFSHLTPRDRDQLIAAVAANQAAKRSRLAAESQQKQQQKQECSVDKHSKATETLDETQNVVGVSDTKPLLTYCLPATLQGIVNLPPSLLPPHGLVPETVSHWG